MHHRQIFPLFLRLGAMSILPFLPVRRPECEKKANSQSRSPPMATSSQNCTQPWTHAFGRASVSNANVGGGLWLSSDRPFILPPTPVPCHSVWPRGQLHASRCTSHRIVLEPGISGSWYTPDFSRIGMNDDP